MPALSSGGSPDCEEVFWNLPVRVVVLISGSLFSLKELTGEISVQVIICWELGQLM